MNYSYLKNDHPFETPLVLNSGTYYNVSEYMASMKVIHEERGRNYVIQLLRNIIKYKFSWENNPKTFLSLVYFDITEYTGGGGEIGVILGMILERREEILDNEWV